MCLILPQDIIGVIVRGEYLHRIVPTWPEESREDTGGASGTDMMGSGGTDRGRLIRDPIYPRREPSGGRGRE